MTDWPVFICLFQYKLMYTEGTMNGQDVARLVFDNSAKKYYVEYDGYMYNHIGHGIIALNRLAASSKRIQRYTT